MDIINLSIKSKQSNITPNPIHIIITYCLNMSIYLDWAKYLLFLVFLSGIKPDI